ncbi:MAG: phytoene desaturase family protein [Jatrophihabitans sp.]|uniref:phytoene desaturase family protein n=1 Tax=Jatrophihabitans sp. TaxID=1932789 RepID=UPI003F7D4817
MARIVVIGAGVGGLTAAARLAASGHDVTVCEAAPTVGGKLASRSVTVEQGTFRFDLGPTLLTLPEVFHELFAATGDALELPLQRLDTIVRHRFADGAQVDTVSNAVAQRLVMDEAFGAGAGAAWQRLMDRGAAIWRAVEEPIFRTPLSPRLAFGLAARLRHLGDLRAVAPGRTLRSVARSLFLDERQQRMLERYATYEGSDPRRAPAALAVVPYLEAAHGAWYVPGGLHRIAGALADRVADRGGRLRLGTRVTAIETDGGRVSGVRLADGRRLPAEVVVANADASSVYGQLLTERHRLDRAAPPADSLSGVVLLLGLRGRTPGLAHHTVLFGDRPYGDEFDAVFGRPGRPVADPVLYLNVPGDAAPSGFEAMYVLVNAPRQGEPGGPGTFDWTAPGVAKRYADDLLELLAKRGVDVRDRVLFREVRTPADLARDTLAPGGAIYGRVQHGALSTLRRPANRSRTRGLFLVGGSTHPGGGLPLVALSGTVVADLVGPA